MTSMLAGVAAALAVLLAVAPRPRLPAPAATAPRVAGRPRPRRLLLSVLAGVGAGLFLGGTWAFPSGVAVMLIAWWWLGTVEPADVRRARERAVHDLPALVGLLAAGLRSGAAPSTAVRLACQALPGPAADRLDGVAHRLALGADPVGVWRQLEGDDALASLGRGMARAHETGASVVETVDRLATELDDELQAAAEARARSVGVKAALPLGLCLLPSFLLLGIVPLAAGLLRGITS